MVMPIQFSAQIRISDDYWRPKGRYEEAAEQMKWLDRSAVSEFIQRTTSDDILVEVKAKNKDNNHAVLSINRPADDVPESIQEFLEPIQIANFTYNSTVSKLDMSAVQSWILEKILYVDKELSVWDAQKTFGTSVAKEDNSSIAEKITSSYKAKGLDKIAGMKDFKEMLDDEVLGPLKFPNLYKSVRAQQPNGILLYGPPGCGKTYLAECLAEEMGRNFYKLEMKDVGSKWLHDTSVAIAKLIDKAKKNGPSVLFIDEVDSWAVDREGLESHHASKKEEMTELLRGLNNAADEGVMVIAATNVPDQIDPAILRAGRFDKHLYMPPPDEVARKVSLIHHMEDRNTEGIIDYDSLAQQTEGFAQTDLILLINTAALKAVKRARTENANIAAIKMEDFDFALKVVLPSVPEDVEEKYKKAAEEAGLRNSELSFEADA